jgi:glycosyltransferase involved in cell wall biosynthesis
MNISVVMPTRKRVAFLKKSISSILDLAKTPEKVEILLRIDNDDEETITCYKEEEIFRNENIKAYVGERLGWNYIWLYYTFLFKKSVGDIIIPFGDDYYMTTKHWDEFLLPYKDKVCFIGPSDRERCRFAFTRKTYDKFLFVKVFSGKKEYADTILKRWAINKGIYEGCQSLFEVHKDFKDDTNSEGRFGGWKLKDVGVILHQNIKLLE